MHNYLRAIGFENFKSREDIQQLIAMTVQQADSRSYVTKDGEKLIGEFCKDFADGIGICVCGEFNEQDKFLYDYYYPYIRGTRITTEEDITVSRHSSKESYAGVCDDLRVGVTIIFYLQNMIPYIKIQNENRFPIKGTTLTLSALSLKGTVMMPIAKTESDKSFAKKRTREREMLMHKARKGDESAMESLSIDDMDTYSAISKQIKTTDIYTLVDNYFMPFGVECDQYSIMGEIIECHEEKNSLTGQTLEIMTINCNELIFDVCINKKDLLGEPMPGRRFKGNIWMQGIVNYPDM
ncbi:DUF3881 family protein [Butyrivibrio sp. AE3004]|uniref:DUF3881 family protein n=1 Tax=Butyrivibrio sp. AE3004 TaxID=1506994 RepID=UPI00049425EF|nr:DUF3881 family protein [Butyrivibrio sp. AE3004]